MAKTGLILEGGGMKCAYGAGVLDAFNENNINFDYVIGVSAGAANGASYLAGQIGRNKKFYTDHVTEPEYFGFRNFLKCGDMFNLRYIYGTLTNTDGASPWDFDKAMANPAEYEVVATNAITGEPAYFSKEQMMKNNYIHIMASSAIPAICKPVMINGTPYYDGGISDPLPFARAIEKGCKKLVFVLSKSRNYVKHKEKYRPVYSVLCHKYPQAIKDMDNRHITYTKRQKKMYELEKAGRAFIFSVETDLTIKTTTMDPELNQKLYELGLKDFEEKKEALYEFLSK